MHRERYTCVDDLLRFASVQRTRQMRCSCIHRADLKIRNSHYVTFCSRVTVCLAKPLDPNKTFYVNGLVIQNTVANDN